MRYAEDHRKINGLPQEQDFSIHTGDLSHNAKAAEFDTLDQVLKDAKPKQVFYVPGEHDTSIDDGKLYLERFGKNAKGRGWYSFTHKDVHFVGLSNVALEGLGVLSPDQTNGRRPKAQPPTVPSCSLTFRSGPCIPIGDGEPRIAPRLSAP